MATLMQGFPPAKESQVDLSNWRKAPFNRWAFSHVCEIVPSAIIDNDRDEFTPFEARMQDLSDFSLQENGGELKFDDWLEQTYTDGIVILRKGKLVYEKYFGELKPNRPHILMSVSKSVLGLLYGIVAQRQNLNLNTLVTDILPEVKDTAYAGASLRDLLDMRAGVEFDENYLASSGKIIAYRKAQGWDPFLPCDEKTNLREFFGTLKESDGGHNERFHYASPNTDLLGWAIERVTSVRYTDLLSELIWQPLGAQEKAYITVDSTGAPRCAGGLNCTARDMARLGRLFVTQGTANGRQIVPPQWLKDILTAGSREAWDGGDFYEFYEKRPMHYRSKWYVERGEHPLVFGLGVFGQNLFIEPQSDLVIAKFSSQPLPLDAKFNSLTHRGIDRLREILR